MNEAGDKTLAVGLLMESAHAHQRSAEHQLERLRQHTQELDGVVRDEIKRTLIEGLTELNVETQRTARSMQKARRGMGCHRRTAGRVGVSRLVAVLGNTAWHGRRSCLYTTQLSAIPAVGLGHGALGNELRVVARAGGGCCRNPSA